MYTGTVPQLRAGKTDHDTEIVSCKNIIEIGAIFNFWRFSKVLKGH